MDYQTVLAIGVWERMSCFYIKGGQTFWTAGNKQIFCCWRAALMYCAYKSKKNNKISNTL